MGRRHCDWGPDRPNGGCPTPRPVTLELARACIVGVPCCTLEGYGLERTICRLVQVSSSRGAYSRFRSQLFTARETSRCAPVKPFACGSRTASASKDDWSPSTRALSCYGLRDRTQSSLSRRLILYGCDATPLDAMRSLAASSWGGSRSGWRHGCVPQSPRA